MQLTTMSCSASSSASGSPGVNWSIRTDANGDATADGGRWVRTVTSLIPSADSARTAPRAVAPKLITAALRRRP